MAERAKTATREKAGKSLSLILWFAFSIFALLIVVVFVLVQNALVVQQYRDSTRSMLQDANERMTAEIAASQNSSRLERGAHQHSQ